MKSITKAIIPAAGYGTRHLPITKAIPKEMLPILNRPAIDYVVEECVASGITDICIVVSRGKNAILDYFDRTPEVEAALIASDKRGLLRKLDPYKDKINITYVRQPEMKGTACAVKMCHEFTAGEPFAVLFPDDVMFNTEYPVTKQLMDCYDTTGSTIVGVHKLPPEEAAKYGVMDPVETKGRYTRIRGYIEKPDLKTMPSTITSLGRFVLSPEIFYYIDRIKPTINGELYLSNAIDLMAKELNVFAYDFEGERYDIGSDEGFVRANIDYALRDETLKEKVLSYIRSK